MKTLGLLQSPVDGEVLAAASALGRVLKTRGWSWDNLIVAPGTGRNRGRSQHREKASDEKDWRRTARNCVAAALTEEFVGLVKPNEVGFLMTVLQRDLELTARQAKWLADIALRLRRAGANVA